MWNAKRDMIDLYELAMNVFGPKGVWIYNQCIKFYCFQLFLAAFLSVTLLYSSVCMLTIDYIECQRDKITEVYVFAPFMFNKSSHLGNHLVFKNLNIIQIDIQKENNR